jgi:hypothetical protein
MSDFNFDWPPIIPIGAIVAALAFVAWKKRRFLARMLRPRRAGHVPVRTALPHTAARSSGFIGRFIAAWRERARRIRPFVLPVLGIVLLLLTIAAAVAVMTWRTLEQPSREVVGLVILSGVLYGAAACVALAIVLGRLDRSRAVTDASGGGEVAAEIAAIWKRMEEMKLLLESLRSDDDRLKPIKDRLATLEQSSRNATTSAAVQDQLKKYATSESVTSLKTTSDDVVSRLSASENTMATLRKEFAAVTADARTAKARTDVLENAPFASHVFLNRPALSSTLISLVKTRYLFVVANEKYRTALATWTRSEQLQLALKHGEDLYQESVRLLHAATDLTPRRRAHWEQLNQRTSARLHAAIPLVDRLAQLRDVRDDSEEKMYAILDGMRPLEEFLGWSIVPRQQGDAIPTLDAAATERYLRESARKMLELTVMPLVLLAQELFEARVHEDGVPADAQYQYESENFKNGRRRGSLLDAVSRAAKLLGFTYRPIALYSSVQSEAGQLLKPHSHPRVTWQEWIGRDDRRTGIIVRLERPAFTEEPGGKLLYEGASAIIGGPGNAGRD